MTTGSRGPGLPTLLLPRDDRRLDRRLLRLSLILAVALHAVALMLPLPAAPVAEPPRDPGPPVFEINETYLPPPPLPELPVVSPTGPVRRVAVPMIERVDVEPLREHRAELPVERLDAPYTSFNALDTVAPPPAPEPLPENTAGLVPPVIVGPRTAPAYPEAARISRVEGVVVLRAVIGIDGRVTSIEVIQAPRSDLGFSDAAVQAVSGWTYSPGLYRGRPVPVYVTVFVDFELF
jgi:protein TonB